MHVFITNCTLTCADDSVEVAVGFAKESGAVLQDLSPQGMNGYGLCMNVCSMYELPVTMNVVG